MLILSGSKWSNSGDSDVPLVAILTTVTVGCAVIAIAIATVCIVILCRRKGKLSYHFPLGFFIVDFRVRSVNLRI